MQTAKLFLQRGRIELAPDSCSAARPWEVRENVKAGSRQTMRSFQNEKDWPKQYPSQMLFSAFNEEGEGKENSTNPTKIFWSAGVTICKHFKSRNVPTFSG